MENIKKLEPAFDHATTLALATMSDDRPNVRIVNFVWDKNEPNIVYFTSDKNNNKVVEINEKPNVAFTTIPENNSEITHIKSNNAFAKKSEKTVLELKDLFIKKDPDYAQSLEYIGDNLIVFEINMSSAIIISGFDESLEINF